MEQTSNARKLTIPSIGTRLILQSLLVLLLLGAGLFRLEAREFWWDEGWTLSVARNWVERGHYGRLLNGQPAPPGLEAAFPVTAPVAVSFRLLGVGIWQGRVPGVLFSVAALALFVWLAGRLFNQRVAGATLVALLLFTIHPQTHPLLIGRQVLGEMPMLFYLVGGYFSLFLSLERSRWFLLAAATLWGLALLSKVQALPFWAASLAIPLAIALLRRRLQLATVLGLALVGSYVAMKVLLQLQSLVLTGQSLSVTPLEGLYTVVAFVLNPFNRLFALKMVFICGIPTLAGLLYATWRELRRGLPQLEDSRAVVRCSLLLLTGSWFAWFSLLSVGVPRYLFPAIFFGSLFVAWMLHELSDGFNAAETVRAAARPFTRRGVGALLAIMLVSMALPLTLLNLIGKYRAPIDNAPLQVAAYFNTRTEHDVLIETYESELHFLLARPYHFPPDQLHVELNRRSLLQQEVAIDYNPLAADPDYLVIGRFASENGLYDPIVATSHFRLVETIGRYRIYERAH